VDRHVFPADRIASAYQFPTLAAETATNDLSFDYGLGWGLYGACWEEPFKEGMTGWHTTWYALPAGAGILIMTKAPAARMLRSSARDTHPQHLYAV
jgi:hypothetical protein